MSDQEHLTGGSSPHYYRVAVHDPSSPDVMPYEVECNDVIEALHLTFAEGNILKAIWRIAMSRMQRGKWGTTPLYDAEKCLYFALRVHERERRAQEMEATHDQRGSGEGAEAHRRAARRAHVEDRISAHHEAGTALPLELVIAGLETGALEIDPTSLLPSSPEEPQVERYDYKAPEMDADPVVRASTQELSEAGDGLLATLTERGIVRDGLIRDDVRAADLIDALTTPPHIEDAGTDGFSHDHIMLADVTVLPDGSVGG